MMPENWHICVNKGITYLLNVHQWLYYDFGYVKLVTIVTRIAPFSLALNIEACRQKKACIKDKTIITELEYNQHTHTKKTKK